MNATLRDIDLGWIRVGTIDDIPRQAARRVRTQGALIAIFRTSDDQVFALEDRCPHRNGPLSEGIVHGNCVTCPLHNSVISLADGSIQGPDEGTARTFPVRLEGRDILLGLSPKTA